MYGTTLSAYLRHMFSLFQLSQQPSFHMTTQIDLNMCISSPNIGLDSKDRVCNVPEVCLYAIVSNTKLGIYEMHRINRQWIVVVARQHI